MEMVNSTGQQNTHTYKFYFFPAEKRYLLLLGVISGFIYKFFLEEKTSDASYNFHTPRRDIYIYIYIYIYMYIALSIDLECKYLFTFLSQGVLLLFDLCFRG